MVLAGVLAWFANPSLAKCPTHAVEIYGKVECQSEVNDRVLAALIFDERRPEPSGDEVALDLRGNTFSGRVAFDTYSSSGFFHGDVCKRHPKTVLVRLVKSDGTEMDRLSLKFPSDFNYSEEQGAHVLKSSVVLHGRCEPQGSGPSKDVRASWGRVSAGPFSILAPPGWQFRPLQGVDSYVGEFIGDGIVLTFDLGRYSSSLDEAKEPGYVIVRKAIGGRSAKIVSPRSPGHGVTGVYFRNVGESSALCLFGQDLTPPQQELALTILETIQFGGSTPPSVIPPPPPRAEK